FPAGPSRREPLIRHTSQEERLRGAELVELELLGLLAPEWEAPLLGRFDDAVQRHEQCGGQGARSRQSINFRPCNRRPILQSSGRRLLLLDFRRRTDLAERRDRMDMDRMGRDVAAKWTVEPVLVPRVPRRTVETE